MTRSPAHLLWYHDRRHPPEQFNKYYGGVTSRLACLSHRGDKVQRTSRQLEQSLECFRYSMWHCTKLVTLKSMATFQGPAVLCQYQSLVLSLESLSRVDDPCTWKTGA